MRFLSILGVTIAAVAVGAPVEAQELSTRSVRSAATHCAKAINGTDVSPSSLREAGWAFRSTLNLAQGWAEYGHSGFPGMSIIHHPEYHFCGVVLQANHPVAREVDQVFEAMFQGVLAPDGTRAGMLGNDRFVIYDRQELDGRDIMILKIIHQQ